MLSGMSNPDRFSKTLSCSISVTSTNLPIPFSKDVQVKNSLFTTYSGLPKTPSQVQKGGRQSPASFFKLASLK